MVVPLFYFKIWAEYAEEPPLKRHYWYLLTCPGQILRYSIILGYFDWHKGCWDDLAEHSVAEIEGHDTEAMRRCAITITPASASRFRQRRISYILDDLRLWRSPRYSLYFSCYQMPSHASRLLRDRHIYLPDDERHKSICYDYTLFFISLSLPLYIFSRRRRRHTTHAASRQLDFRATVALLRCLSWMMMRFQWVLQRSASPLESLITYQKHAPLPASPNFRWWIACIGKYRFIYMPPLLTIWISKKLRYDTSATSTSCVLYIENNDAHW